MNGSPSDQRMPWRRRTVSCELSAFHSQARATLGTTFNESSGSSSMSGSMLTCAIMYQLAGSCLMAVTLPPYWPISSLTCTTSGSGGSRSSTGGSFPSATICARLGASRYLPVAIGAAVSAAPDSSSAPPAQSNAPEHRSSGIRSRVMLFFTTMYPSFEVLRGVVVACPCSRLQGLPATMGHPRAAVKRAPGGQGGPGSVIPGGESPFFDAKRKLTG